MSKKKKNKNQNAVAQAPAAEEVVVEETVEAVEETAAGEAAEVSAAAQEAEITAQDPVSDETTVMNIEDSVGSVVAEMLGETASSEETQEPAAESSEDVQEEFADEEPVEETEKGPRPPWYKTLWKWAVRLRSVPLAIPVIVIMIILAVRSAAVLPDSMMIGEYELTKQLAVFGPVVATSLSLLMMFISKRIIYPWLISIFTLVVPIFIQLVAPFFA